MQDTRTVRLFSATRFSKEEFSGSSFLGKSLGVIPEKLQPQTHIQFCNSGDNAVGLSEYYNRCLDNCGMHDIAVLVHDDVYLHNWYLVNQVRKAAREFDIFGVVGSSAPDLDQPSWSLKFSSGLEPEGWQQDAGLSGSLSHFTPENPYIGYYGPAPERCVLIDGLFIGINVENVRQAGVRFDPVFRFHCYDIDFCRSAARAGLRIGTWDIPVTHASGGSFESRSWRDAARIYLEKWKTATGG